MTDFELMFAPGPHKEEFKRWKETISFLYGQNYADRFCSLEIFKKHLSAMGFYEEGKKRDNPENDNSDRDI